MKEGVIKFDLRFRTGPPPDVALTTELDAWRRVLRALGLIGQDERRYEGLGFGNLSRRVVENGHGGCAFIISGSQTGHLVATGPGHYARVNACDPAHNCIDAEGPVRPSSESLTHCVLYRLDPAINAVFHVHSPDIWRRADDLGLPVTAAGVEYGTPAMAAEVARLYGDESVRRGGLFVMRGHEDGVIAFGADCTTAGTRLVAALVSAFSHGAR